MDWIHSSVSDIIKSVVIIGHNSAICSYNIKHNEITFYGYDLLRPKFNNQQDKKIPRLSDGTYEAVYELFKRVTNRLVISILFIIFVPEDLIQSYILQRSRVQVILPKS